MDGDEVGMRRPLYQDEPAYLASGIFERGYITPWELFKIVTWKSAKGVAWLSLNDENEIITCTKETITGLKLWSGPDNILETEMTDELWDLWEAKAGELIGVDERWTSDRVSSGLLRLHGIGFPVATAILGLLKPGVFPVMDRWAVESIFGIGESRRRWQTRAMYRAYAERLVNPEIVELRDLRTLRERDKAAMNRSMPKRL